MVAFENMVCATRVNPVAHPDNPWKEQGCPMAPATSSDAPSATTTHVLHARFLVSPKTSPVLLALTLLGAVAVLSALIYMYTMDRRRARAIQAQRRGVRALVLSDFGGSPLGSGDDVFKSDGPKPLILPALATVRSSRGKASILKSFVGKFPRDGFKRLVRHASPSPPISGSVLSTCDNGYNAGAAKKAIIGLGFEGLDEDWTRAHLRAFRAAQDIRLSLPLGPSSEPTIGFKGDSQYSLASDGCSLHSEDMPVLRAAHIPTITVPAPAMMVDHYIGPQQSPLSASSDGEYSIHETVAADYLQVIMSSWTAPKEASWVEIDHIEDTAAVNTSNVPGNRPVLAPPPLPPASVESTAHELDMSDSVVAIHDASLEDVRVADS
ncbi:hypothetical protein WOLCODRAFT_145268 [Wolfiporia cocos MD-104 SS10]|uniref:Uncharacterized protein n=1 Tax=Wolfiporia cocos (strain MD-104) TaxID=742152 RepID=A0A2H3JS37_WOLCO|nr:hypothetical protein WOLCODRAFT_145268 [Wolfiporia cocos MD-104 SS10]